MNLCCLNADEREAARLFRIVHGPGDSGSISEMLMLNPAIFDGWVRLGRHVRLARMARSSMAQRRRLRVQKEA